MSPRGHWQCLQTQWVTMICGVLLSEWAEAGMVPVMLHCIKQLPKKNSRPQCEECWLDRVLDPHLRALVLLLLKPIIFWSHCASPRPVCPHVKLPPAGCGAERLEAHRAGVQHWPSPYFLLLAGGRASVPPTRP